MQDFLDFFGHGFCHQIRDRCLEAGGVFFSACARDTGLYLGLVLTVLIICLFYKQRARGLRTVDEQQCTATVSQNSSAFGASQASQLPAAATPLPRYPSGLPPLPVVIVTILLILPMAIDGITSYAYLRETDNLIRFFTGYGAGMGVGLVAACVVLGLFRGSSDRERTLASMQPVVITLVASSLAALAFWLVYHWLGLAAPLLAVAAFLALVVMLNVALLAQSRRLALPVALVALEATGSPFSALETHTGVGQNELGRQPMTNLGHSEAQDGQTASASPQRVKASTHRWLCVLALALILALCEIALLGAVRDWVFALLFNGTVDSFQELFDQIRA